MRHSYYVVMIYYPRRERGDGTIQAAGCEATVNPEITRSGTIELIRTGEYSRIQYIHEVAVDHDGIGYSRDVTNELLREAGVYDPVYQAAE